ncbi:hypothetical protein [Vibrio sp. MA40-2]|uniref:hypothetical protein n=1 Tax=Vibrio sp. MA40-2 TaxID=3391828 RepID=UPI0039A6DFA8
MIIRLNDISYSYTIRKYLGITAIGRRMTSDVRYLFTLSLSLCPLPSLAQSDSVIPDQEIAMLPSNVFSLRGVPPSSESEPYLDSFDHQDETFWLDETKQYFADSVHDFSLFIDQGLAKDDNEAPLVNKSYLKIKYRAEYSDLGYFESDERISVRIDLPHVKHDWKLILETDPDDYDSLEDKQRGLSSDNSKNVINGAIGGVRLQDEEIKHWRTNLDVGVKIRLPIDPFTRVQLRRVENFSQYWTAQFKQEVFYYHSVGSGSLTELNFYKQMTDNFSEILKMSSSAQYIYEDDNWEVLFQLEYFDRLNTNHLLEYSSGITFEPNQADEISNYWLSASWRQKLYSDWLYMSMTPQINFPREFDYKINPGFQLEFEAFFSKNRNLDRLNRFIPKSTRISSSGI